MPRGPRLDTPQALHHVMARGIARQVIFHDDLDRDDFLNRVARLADIGAFQIFAWALLPNHFHLLLKTGTTALSNAMRSLLTGHAGWFNRRHGRVGHFFQNRYKSIVCEEEPYFLELVRYIHLNPLRAGIVASWAELEGYPYSGHSAIMGTVPRPWQTTPLVLDRFASTGVDAKDAYNRFVLAAAARGRRADLSGGGLRRSAGAWTAVEELSRGRECFTHDERVLGRPRFVESLLRARVHPPAHNADQDILLEDVVRLVCRAVAISRANLLHSTRTRARSRAREGIAFLWICYLGRSGHELAARLGFAPVSAYRSAKRGEREGPEWCRLLHTLKATEGN